MIPISGKLLLLTLFAVSTPIIIFTGANSSDFSGNQIDTVKILYDSIELNEQKFIKVTNYNLAKSLISLRGDTVVSEQNYYSNFDFLDINEDGFKDIRVYFFSNTPNQCDNYLYDSISQSFKYIENSDLDIRKISGTDFYFSYNRAGCADYTWESHLCKIENYSQVNYGYIHGQGCDTRKRDDRIITIYRVIENNNILKEKLPYSKNIKEFGDKWDFIESYWEKNYSQFQ
jgi:hypothetical protein